MTPAQVARASMRLADALDVVRDECEREDAHPGIIKAHAGAAVDLCQDIACALDHNSDLAAPAGCEPETITLALESDRGPLRADLPRWADAWRSWGEARRAEANSWLIEFRSGTFFQGLDADSGGSRESAWRFATEADADALIRTHAWIAFAGGMPVAYVVPK